MKLYYTTTAGADTIQDSPKLSLGGYKSSSLLPNSKLNNLFGEISQVTISNYNQNSYIGLILKNELLTSCNNVKLWFNHPENCYSKLRVAIVQVSQDSNGDNYIEHITDKYSKPLYVNGFIEADGEDNKVDLGNIASEGMIGIWIERELLLDEIKQDQETPYELQSGYTDRFQERELNKEDEIKLNISWD